MFLVVINTSPLQLPYKYFVIIFFQGRSEMAKGNGESLTILILKHFL